MIINGYNFNIEYPNIYEVCSKCNNKVLKGRLFTENNICIKCIGVCKK